MKKTNVIFRMFSNLCTLDSKSANFSFQCPIEEETIWVGEMFQLSRTVGTHPEDWGLFPIIHDAASTKFQGSDSLSGFHSQSCTWYTDTHVAKTPTPIE